jgi:replicative DNA helicase
VTSAGVDYHAQIVKRMSQRRKIVNLCLRITDQAHDMTEDEENTFSNLKNGIRAIEDGEVTPIEDTLSNKALYTKIWEDLWNDHGEPYPPGLRDLSQIR